MKARELRRRLGLKVIPGVMTIAMAATQPLSTMAAELDSQGNVTVQPERQTALDSTGERVLISENVLAMMDSGMVYLDETTGYLYDKVTGEKVEPVSGEHFKDETEEPEEPAAPEVPEEPDTPEEPETPAPPEEPEVPVTPDVTGNQTNEQPKDTAAGGNANQAEDAAAQKYSSNEELIAGQQIVKLPVIVQDFRFWTVARRHAFAKQDLPVYEGMAEDARAVGTLEKGGLCYVLKEEADGWLYVESGNVRGFIKEQDAVQGEKAQKIIQGIQRRAKAKARKDGTQYQGVESLMPLAKELISKEENSAYCYTRSTVNATTVEKEYALSTAGMLNVREGKSTDSRIVGTIKENGLCYILADADQEWVYIESGDVRGFVKSEYIKAGEETANYVAEAKEENFALADKVIEPEENAACYYTLTSVKSGVPGGEIRESLLEFSSQFIGNPYVWGGTSLTDGADCSGFVQSIYKQYGYDLPRVAEDQAQYGTKIPVEDAQPGDLIFYAKNGNIHHVVIYAGDGKTIEAKGRAYGIVQDELNTAQAVWAVRILDDSWYGSTNIGEVNATAEMYGKNMGNFKLTYYCSCELCCDVETGITATGTHVIEGQTIAVDPKVIPYGTKVIIGGHIFTAQDCGGAVKGNHIDIYVNNHEKALAMGVNYADVYLVK